MFKNFVRFAIIMSLVLGTVIFFSPVTSAEATTANRWMGTFTGSEPTFDSPGCNVGSPNEYITVSFTPTVSGDYYYNDLSIYQTGGEDIQLDLYENSFDPLNPNTNWVDWSDDGGTFAGLVSGTTYIAVISELCGGAAIGNWDFALSGPGSLNGTHPVFSGEGTFDGAESTFDSPECGANTPYDVIGPYTPTVSGDYGYGDVSINYDIDIHLEIYMTSFDPSDPLTNYVLSVEDNYDDTDAYPLTAGVEYYFVITPHSCLVDIGTWEFVLGGPGVLIVPGSDAPGVSVPNFGEVMITSEIAQFGYGAPAGEPARNPDGSGVWLPHDWDGNGFDTYVVTGSTDVDGEIWLSIFIGNEQWVWVPQSTVITIR